MATVKGMDGVKQFLRSLPAKLESNVLKGALKAGADVIAEAARENCHSDDVRAAIKTSAKVADHRVTAKIEIKGEGAYKAVWLEYGTSAHFISVDDSVREGRTVGRINRQGKAAKKAGSVGPAATLVINGKPVGETVWHPGARPHPFLRPALDLHEEQALAAMRGHIVQKMTKAGIETADSEGEGE